MAIAERNRDLLPEGRMLIDGKFLSRGGNGDMSHVDPTTGQELGKFPLAGPDDVNAAIAAARRAFPAWRDLPGAARRDMLLKLADLLEEEGDRFAPLGVMDNGCPIVFGRRACVEGPAGWLRYYAGWADKIEGRTIPFAPTTTLNYTITEPVGVVALLLAFNGPMSFLGFKLAPALAAGNTVVIKPSELAPWCVMLFGELCERAGIPPGVINILPGDGRTGAAIAAHPGINKISFTGGGGTARHILAAAANNLTPAAMELGGKSASIIFDDALLDQAVATAVGPALSLMSGQVCLSGTRLLVQRSIYQEVVDRAIAIAQGVVQGDPMDAATQMGPVISRFHQDRILAMIDKARSSGDGRMVTGGAALGGEFEAGAFVQPTVFADVDPASHLAQTEVFGPVLSMIPFDDEDDAVRIANNTAFGLAGYVFTENLGRAHRMAAKIETGFLSVNTYGLLNPGIPFGGVKQSGFGREGGYEGLLEFLHVKNVQVRIS